MQLAFKITYFFTSTSAHGNDYERSIIVKARSLKGAESLAKGEGFREFGERFTDNCIDWKVEAV